jgi:hypothetical protein
MFDVLLALKRRGDRVVGIEVNQRLDAITLGETLCQAFSMLATRRTKSFVTPT